MSFIWPMALLALVLVPLAAWGYYAVMRRRANRSSGLAASGLVTVGTPAATGRRRHVPFAILLLGLTVMIVALARPQVALALPKLNGTVILSIDVSTSMSADDIAPSRLEAAKAAAKQFVESQPAGVDIGVVAVGTGSQVAAAPTDNRDEVLAAIDRLTASGGTQIGTGLIAALGPIIGTSYTIPPEALDPEASVDAIEAALADIDTGLHPSSAIVLVSDGEDTGGISPTVAAELAAKAGVRISIVGIGTPEGAVIDVDGYQISTALDEEQLRTIADLTGGTYYAATDAASMSQVYDDLTLQWEASGETVEITGLLAGIALAILLIAAIVSVIWLGRVI